MAALKAAVEDGRAEIFIDAACEAELVRVLAYDLGKHSIGAEKQAACIAECRRIAKALHQTEKIPALPRCPVAEDPAAVSAFFGDGVVVSA